MDMTSKKNRMVDDTPEKENPYLKQVSGTHYMYMKIQPAEFINKNKLQFAEGNAIKYICRHAAKGGEADNVLLVLDNTKKIREAVDKDQDKRDEEHRVWYVGVTRTKQNLYIMEAKKEWNGYDI